MGKTPVLLVDDQVLVAHVIRRMLAADSNFIFHYEQDPRQALESVIGIKPTVILQDLDMPGIDGLDLLKAFRGNPHTRAISIIVLSAKEDPASKQAAFEAGADDYLVKMPGRTEFLARVRRLSDVCVRELAFQEEVRALKESQAALQDKNNELIRRNDELTGMILDGSSRMQALVTGLLTYSRAGQSESMETVDTEAALQQVLANLTSAIGEAKAEVVFENLPALQFLSGQFNHLLQNLVGNAIKYRGAARPKVHVSAVRQLDAWVFSIADNGIGFDPQDGDKIFGIFQRLHGREDYAGTGIGLALVKKLVERRGGWIWVDSVPEHGSTFYFSVPDAVTMWQMSSEQTAPRYSGA